MSAIETLQLAPVSPSLTRKTSLKFLVRRFFGELYVGKRMKMRHLTRIVHKLHVPRNAKILEVGCEDGTFSNWLRQLFPVASIAAIDRDVNQIHANQQWAQATGNGIQFRHQDVCQLAEASKFNLITCFDVLGYIPDDRLAISNMARALAPGGILLIHQPNTTYQRFDGSREYVPPERAGQITEGHIRHGYSPAELRSLLAAIPEIADVQVIPLHGRLTDIAYRIYLLLEHPWPLRVLSLPFVDLLCEMDRHWPQDHGNTLCAIARRRGLDAAEHA